MEMVQQMLHLIVSNAFSFIYSQIKVTKEKNVQWVTVKTVSSDNSKNKSKLKEIPNSYQKVRNKMAK